MSALFDLSAGAIRLGKSKAATVYASYVENLQGVTAEVAKLRAEIEEILKEQSQLLISSRDSTQQNLAQSELSKSSTTEITDKLTLAKNAADEIDAKLAAIRESSVAAASLDKQVQSYRSSFEAFQASLDGNMTRHNDLVHETSEAVVKNERREAEIDRLIVKADSMISGATTAGLGDSLEKTRKQYESSRDTARLMFFGSVVLLAISAVPLVAQVLPGLFSAWLPTVAPGATQGPLSSGDLALGLLGKIFLLFPATWLTQFCSKAYSEFFHLEREYAHKAALARSVEGFKKQAPKYEEEITTAVFFEVQTNPSKQKAPDAAEHPIMGPLMKKFIDGLPLGRC